MRPLNDRFLCPDDFELPEQVQLSAENDPPRIRIAGIAGICLILAAGVVVVGWLA